ncbi:MAG TPA: RluA family pseudouridine synthase [Myxococcales bacterium]|nr:RluA family pseudouridine synthase [Myxococcales bacterium]
MTPRGRPSRKQRECDRQKRPPPAIAEERSFEAPHGGERLVKLAASQFPDLSRARVQQLIAAGLVDVDGRPAAAADRPRAGAVVRVRLPEIAPPRLDPVRLDLPVLYDDEHLVVIDKPAGLAVHPGAGGEGTTIVHGLLHQVRDLRGVGGELRPGIVHRLDKDTSGCLVVAKTEPVLRALQAAFKARDVEKRYRALVHGSPPDCGELDTLYGRHPVDRKRFSSRVRAGKRAVTRFSILARAQGAAFLDVELLTGRTHQIRAHLADRGWPLFCDALYGATRREGPAAPPAIRRAAAALGRQGLHAARLAFTHPVTGARVACEAPLPADLRAALRELGLHSAA